MSLDSARKDAPSAGTEKQELKHVLDVTRELADYARAHDFPHADELLTEVLAALLTRSPECIHQALLDAEERALTAMRLVLKLAEKEE